MACNERCPFCNVPVEDYPRPTPPPEEIESELDAFVTSGARTLTISGGEPTLLRRRLIALISRARARGLAFVELQTNAVLIDAGYARALREAGLTSAFVSLLSHQESHHDHLAGLAGAFGRCLRGIDALLAEGVRVTLNPVIARRTDASAADFVEFVAERLPGVREISLSAVQPHGRAGPDADALLPRYDVLASVIPRARERAAAHDITLLNPYCGLPLCVGWADDPERSVEAIEASDGGWRRTPGLDNRGDKIQGAPCGDCALRTRCGGAWRAYWTIRGGRGIAPPLRSALPWQSGAAEVSGQTVVSAPGGPGPAHFAALGAAATPTVWLWTDRLTAACAVRLRRAGCTDLALEVDPTGLGSSGPARRAIQERGLEAAYRLGRAMATLEPARQLRVRFGVLAAGTADDQAAMVAVASRLPWGPVNLLTADQRLR